MEKSIKSISLNYGIVLGVILSLITVFAYAFMLELFTKWWLGISLLIVVVATATMAASKSKKMLGGYMSFKDAFTAYFITVLVGTLISTLVAILIFNFIDPEAALTLKDMIMDSTRQMMENLGTPQATIDQAMAATAERDMFSLGARFQEFAINLLVFCVIGLIVALAVRRKDPNAVE